MSKSTFDASKDKVIKELGIIETGENAGISVEIKAYDGGTKKIALTRFYTKKNGEKGFSPIGRMNIDEAIELHNVLSTWIEDSSDKDEDGGN